LASSSPAKRGVGVSDAVVASGSLIAS
jgi:hypothetical protein